MTADTLPNFDELWDYNDPATTEQKFRALLPRAEASADRSYHAQLLTQLARAQGLQRKFVDAHATLDQVAQVDQPPARVRYLLERGRVFNTSKQPEKARPLFEQAFALAFEHGLDAHAVDAAHMVAIAEPDQAGQLRWNLRAMELAERSGDERARRWRASLYNNIGWSYFGSKQYDRAMEVFQKAVALRAEQDRPRELRVARYCVAKTLRMQGKLEDAIRINREVISRAEQAGEPDGYFLEELAECLLAMNRSEDAKPYFSLAYEELSKDKWLAENEPARLLRLKSLGQ